MKISIIVPVLNEVKLITLSMAHLYQTLQKIQSDHKQVEFEVIISDAGSKDGTLQAADKTCADYGWQLIDRRLTSPSIGKTIQAALSAVTGEYVLVLPVDTWISIQGITSLIYVLHQHQPDGGGFTKFYSPSSRILKIYAHLQNSIRLKLMRHAVWTNAIFFKRLLISKIEFPTVGFLEDVILSDWLRNKHFEVIEQSVQVSARGYLEQGTFRRICINGFILFLYRLKIWSPGTLKKLYRVVR